MRARIVALGFFFVVSWSSLGADWPQWRGPSRDGISPEKGLLQSWPENGPRLVWNSREVNKDVNKGKNVGTGWSSISIVGKHIYTLGDHNKECHLVCLDRGTGKLVWSTPIGTTRTGDGPRSTPTVDGNRIYGLTSSGQLACVSTDGKILWKKDLVQDFGGKTMAAWHYCESPLVDGNKLICTPGGEKVGMIALDKMTGNVIWEAAIPGSGGAGYSSPIISEGAGVRQYVTLMGSGKGLVSVDAKSGKLLWNYRKVVNGTGNIPTPIIKGDLVFASTGYGTGAVLLKLVSDGSGGVTTEEKYFLNGKTLQNHHGQMVLIGDYVYGGHGHNAGHPFCLHLESGKFAWGPIFQHPGDGSAAITYADGHVYFRWQDNTMGLVEASPGGFVLKSSFPLAEKGIGTGWPQPVVLDGMMYIRGRDQILCFDVRAK